MNKLSRRSIVLLLLYLISATGLTFLMIRKQAKNPDPSPVEHEGKGKLSNRLEPHEWYYLDRNYPAREASYQVYNQLLRDAIRHDQVTTRSHRGLAHPWTIQGPGNLGGRINTIAVHPIDPDIIMLGYSQGGIYRTEDGGLNWYPVFDDQPSLSISHITFDPHDTDQVWAATGDVNISGYPFLGSGVYRSTDAGDTWVYAGLDQTGVLSKILPDPNDPQIIYAGSMGYPSHKGQERGFFRSVNGGATWEKTLAIDDSTGIIDIVADPLFPGRVFASGWTRLRSNLKGTTQGPGTGLFASEDYGATWTSVTNGLPETQHSRTSIEIANDGTLYMTYIGTIEEGSCAGYTESLVGIYKSFDSGMTWESIPVTPEHGLDCDAFGQFGWYFEVLKINPDNPQDMFILGVDIYRSLDGGLSWFPAAPAWWSYEVHADKHDLVFAHGTLYLGTDGGAYKTDVNQANEWTDIESIPSTQFYRTAWNPHTPDLYYGGAQDNGTTGGNATYRDQWPRILGGDGFQPRFDPDEPLWMYALTQNGSVWFSKDGGLDFNGLNRGLRGTRFWDMPLVMSDHDPKILFCGSNKVYRMDMRDSIREWKEMSPDLTRMDTILGNRYPAITAIAQSELDAGRLYAGTQDGLIWTTADGGLNWENITEGTPGNFVTSITCSTIDPMGVYVTYSGYRDNDHQPYIFRSDNAGMVWDPVSADLPMMGVNSFYILPGWNDAVLMAATDGGVYVSLDAGGKWERMGSQMPYMPIYDLDYNPVENTLIAATFSRGIMTFPIEELDLVSSVKTPLSIPYTPVFNVYPTVTIDHFFISSNVKESDFRTVVIQIADLNGKIIQQNQKIIQGHEVIRVEFDSKPKSGLYLVQVRSGNAIEVQKIIVI